MGRKMGNTIPSQPTKLQLLNIAISFAILTSLVYPPIKMIFYALVEHAVFKSIPAYQQHLAHGFLNHWVPATLAYLVLVVTPLGTWLKASRTVNWLLFIANVIVILYTVARILASTVQGGGFSYLVISYSVVTALPAILLIVFSFARIIILSIRFRSAGTGEETSTVNRAVNGHDWVLVTIASAIPTMFGAYVGYGDGSPFREARASAPVFEEMCKGAGDKVYSKKNGAKGILFNPDAGALYTDIKDGVSRSRGGGIIANGLMYRYKIQFIEIAKHSSSPQGDTSVTYYRKKSGDLKKYPIELPASEYGVFTKTITGKREKSIGITGKRTEIIDLHTQEVVASSVYFVSRSDWRFCGYAPNGTYSTDAFISRSLNLKPIKK